MIKLSKCSHLEKLNYILADFEISWQGLLCFMDQAEEWGYLIKYSSCVLYRVSNVITILDSELGVIFYDKPRQFVSDISPFGLWREVKGEYQSFLNSLIRSFVLAEVTGHPILSPTLSHVKLILQEFPVWIRAIPAFLIKSFREDCRDVLLETLRRLCDGFSISAAKLKDFGVKLHLIEL
jgi:hypothetical protein